MVLIENIKLQDLIKRWHLFLTINSENTATKSFYLHSYMYK